MEFKEIFTPQKEIMWVEVEKTVTKKRITE